MKARVKPGLSVNDVVMKMGPSPIDEIIFDAQQWKEVPAGGQARAKVHPKLMVCTEDTDEACDELIKDYVAALAEAESIAKMEEEEVSTGNDLGVDATDTALALMMENGISADEVTGTGANGRILKKDVEAFLTGDAGIVG